MQKGHWNPASIRYPSKTIKANLVTFGAFKLTPEILNQISDYEDLDVKEITFVTGKGEKITLPNNKKIGKKILELSKEISIENYPTSSKNSSGYRLDAIKTISQKNEFCVL